MNLFLSACSVWFGSKIAHFQTDDNRGGYLFVEEEENLKVRKKIIVRGAAFQLSSPEGVITIVLASIATLFFFVLISLFFEYCRKQPCCRMKRTSTDEENPEQDIAMDGVGEDAGDITEGNLGEVEEMKRETLDDEEENKIDKSSSDESSSDESNAIHLKTRDNYSSNGKENVELKEFKITIPSEIKSSGEDSKDISENEM